MAGIELFALRMARRIRTENERSNMSTNRDDVTPTAPAPKEQKSTLVFLTVAFLILGLVLVVVGAILTAPYVAALGIFDGIVAVAFAVLSLREKQ